MQPPEQDLHDRSPVWDRLQFFWMDCDPARELADAARACADSKYSIEELEQIFWNEVRPAVGSNLWALPAPEWAGYDLEQLQALVLRKHRHGRPIRMRWLHSYSASWWRRLAAETRALRKAAVGGKQRTDASER